MSDARNSVVYFSEIVSKSILCKDFGCDYIKVYGSSVFYQCALPQVFMGVLMDDYPKGRVGETTWMSLVDAIPPALLKHARYRCLQIVAEYASVVYENFLILFSHLTEKVVLEMRDALAFFYNPCEGRTCEWMQVAAAFDNHLFRQMIYRIMSGCVSPKTASAFKRALVYAYQVVNAPTRIYLCGSGGLPPAHLWRVRRAYEHILFGRFPVDDFASRHAPLRALQNLHTRSLDNTPKSVYEHSVFDNRAADKAKTSKELVVKGDENTKDLVLRAPPNKTFPFNHYQGALELISCCGESLDTVYVDRRLRHHLLPSREEFLFDEPRFLPCFENESDTRFAIAERLVTRINDYSGQASVASQIDYQPAEKVDRCHKELLLQPTNDLQCESDHVSVTCHIKDFLLWIMSENPTLISTPLSK